jgi:hypothetical protein
MHTAMSKKNTAIEGEIVSQPNTSRSSYTYKTTELSAGSGWLLWFGLFAVFMSLIPIIGLALSLVALVVSKLNKFPIILPIIGIVIGTFTTSVFLLFWLVIKAIF